VRPLRPLAAAALLLVEPQDRQPHQVQRLRGQGARRHAHPQERGSTENSPKSQEPGYSKRGCSCVSRKLLMTHLRQPGLNCFIILESKPSISGRVFHTTTLSECPRTHAQVLNQTLLRRTKEQCADSLSLPPRKITLRRLEFDPREEDFYNAIYTQSQVRALRRPRVRERGGRASGERFSEPKGGGSESCSEHEKVLVRHTETPFLTHPLTRAAVRVLHVRAVRDRPQQLRAHLRPAHPPAPGSWSQVPDSVGYIGQDMRIYAPEPATPADTKTPQRIV
jgi:hypothetical protein